MIVFYTASVLLAVQCLVGSAKDCKVDSDCSWCGYCKKGDTITECYFPYPDVKWKEGKCVKSNLCPEFCKNGATCKAKKGLAVPVCTCADGYYGKQCEEKMTPGQESKLASGIEIYLGEEVVTKGEKLQEGRRLNHGMYLITPFAVTSVDGEKLVFFIEASEGGIQWLNKLKRVRCEGKRSIYVYKKNTNEGLFTNDQCGNYYFNSLYVPFKKYGEKGVMEFTSGGLGYLTTVSVTARNGDVVVFKHEYTKFIYSMNYGITKADLRTFPVIRLTTRCGKTFETRCKYGRNTALSFEAKIDDKLGQLKPEWVLLRVDFDIEGFTRHEPPIPNTNPGNEWKINPFTVNFGSYKLQVVVSKTSRIGSFDQRYIEIIKQPLYSYIDGGKDRTVYLHDGLSLSGKNSYDPNRPRTTDGQKHLQYLWSCAPECESIFGSKRKEQVIFISAEKLEDNRKYTFKLTVSADDIESAEFEQTVTIRSSGGFGISIYCITNCGEKVIPVDRLAFEIKTGLINTTDLKFTWTYSVKGDEDMKSADSIRDSSYPTDMLLIKPNTLEIGKIYTFCAENDADDETRGCTTVIVSDRPANGSCEVNPKEGIAWKTLFTIVCTGYIDDNMILVYEYYDKNKVDMTAEFSGRMLSSNHEGSLANVRLTRGTVAVYVYNLHGVPAISESQITLTHNKLTSEDIDGILKEIRSSTQAKGLNSALLLISMLPDMIGASEDKVDMATKIVEAVTKISFSSYEEVKIGLSIISNTIRTLTNESNITLEAGFVNGVTGLLSCFSRYIKKGSLSKDSETIITEPMMDQLTVAVLDTIDITNQHLNRRIMEVNEYNIHPSDYRNALQFSRHLQESYDNIAYSNAIRNKGRLSTRTVVSTLELSSICSITDNSSRLHKNIQDTFSYLDVSDDLAEKLEVYGEVTLQSMNIKYNPFWSYRKDVSTELLSVKLYHKRVHSKGVVPITSLLRPIDLYLNVISGNSGSITLSAKASSNGHDEDADVTVIRMDMPAQSKLLLKFEPYSPADEIRLVVTEHLRPDHDYMMNFSKVITSSDPYYDVPYHPTKDDYFIYIGILPGASGEANNFKLHFSFNLCLTLIDSYWVADYCSIGERTNTSVIHCKCTHLSILSAVFSVPPNEIDPFRDAKLFLTVTENALVFIIVIVALLIFLLLCVWARYMDHKDKFKREVIILQDNFPKDAYFYIVGVFTGFRLSARTDANVGIKIEGVKNSSRSHILSSPSRKVFNVNADDWFLLRCPRHLGEVQRLHLWHDNTGQSPDWFCEKVIVVDLKSSTTYTFYVEQWLALDDDEYSEALVSTASAGDFNNRSRIFFDNLVNGFRNNHLFGGVIAKHPRHVMHRLDKIVILMVLVMVAMLVSIAFYNIENEVGFEEPRYKISIEDLYMGIQTLLINLLFFGLAIFLFEKSYKTKDDVKTKQTYIYARKDTPNVDEILSKTSNAGFFILQEEGGKKKHKTFLRNLVSATRKSFTPEPLIPVSLMKTDLIIKRNKLWLISAWLISILIITCSAYLVMLYGLKMGYEGSKRWVASVSLSLFDQFALLSPVKILFVGLLLAIVFEYLVYTTNYEIVIGNVDLKRNSSLDFHLLSFLEMRCRPMYRPLNSNEVEIWRIKRQKRRFIESVIEMVIIALFAIIFCCTNINDRNWIEFHANSHIERMVFSRNDSSFIPFLNIINYNDLNDYLRDTFVDDLYNLHWYNLLNLNPHKVESDEELYWTKDCITKLIGRPVLRQLRVFRGSCLLNEIFNRSIILECFPAWSTSTEDNDRYAFGWEMIGWTSSQDHYKAWTFTEPNLTPFIGRRGPTGTWYHGGGYIAELSQSKEKTIEALLSLRRGNWVDKLSAVVFVTFSLYNANTNMFSEVNLLAEHLPSGGLATKAIIRSEQLHFRMKLWNISYVLLVLFFLIRCVITLNRKGIVKCFTTAMDIFQFSLLILGVLSVTFFTVHWFKSATDIENFFNQVGESVFSFVDTFYYSVLAEEINALLFCGLMVYLLTVWFSSQLTFNVYQTISLNKTYLLLTLVLTALLARILTKLGCFLFNLEMRTNALFVKWNSDWSDSVSLSVKVFNLGLSFVYVLLQIAITAVFVYTYKTLRQSYVLLEDDSS